MKTLDEIISRNDYERANSALIKRANELAEIIRGKMIQLGVKAVHTTVRRGNAVCTSANIVLHRTPYYHNGEVCSLPYNLCYKETEYDMDCYYDLDEKDTDGNTGNNKVPTNRMYIIFLNHVRNILAELDEIETEKVAACEQALAAVEGL